MKILRILRIVTALAVFCLISAQFLDIYHKLPKPYFMYNPTATQFAPSLLKMLATGSVLAGAAFLTFTIFALIFGRTYCSFFCPFGILMDILRRMGAKFANGKKGTKFAPPHNALRYAMLGVATLSIGFGYTALFGLIDPYSLFGKIMGDFARPILCDATNGVGDILYSFGAYGLSPVDGNSEVALAAFGFAVAVLAAIAAVSAFRGRLYCNIICPVGAFLGFFARFSLFKIAFDKSKCIGCGICERQCKAQCIDAKNRNLDFSRCVLCFDCAARCPRAALKIVPHKFVSNKTEKEVSKGKEMK